MSDSDQQSSSDDTPSEEEAAQETAAEETTPEETTPEETPPQETPSEETPAQETPLEKSQDAIDEAREAAKKVAASEDIEVGDLPAFADSAAGTEATNAFTEDDDHAEGRADTEDDAGALRDQPRSC